MTVSSISSGKVITASDVLILGKSKIINSSRAGSAASGDVAYTGAGFQPRTIIAFTEQPSWGFADQNLDETNINVRLTSTLSTPAADFSSTYLVELYFSSVTSVYQKAKLKTLDTDGFTLNWDSVSGGGGTPPDITFLCLG